MASPKTRLSYVIQAIIDRLASPNTSTFFQESGCGPLLEQFKVLIQEAKDQVLVAEQKRASYPPLRKSLDDLQKYLDQTEAISNKITRRVLKFKQPSELSEIKSEARESEMQPVVELMMNLNGVGCNLTSILQDHKDATKITKSSLKWLEKLATLPRGLDLFKHDDTVALEGDQLAAYENETTGKILSYQNMPKQCQEYLKVYINCQAGPDI